MSELRVVPMPPEIVFNQRKGHDGDQEKRFASFQPGIG